MTPTSDGFQNCYLYKNNRETLGIPEHRGPTVTATVTLNGNCYRYLNGSVTIAPQLSGLRLKGDAMHCIVMQAGERRP
jgi:hypothetical protein